MHLTLHLTRRCNLACRYCYARAADEDMTLETARQAIARCAEGPHCGLVFFGGEPLLRQDLIWSIIEECERDQPGRFHYKVTTNGTLLDEAFFERADPARLHVALSHDGVVESHDRMRVRPGGGGTFDQLLPRLDLLLKRRPYAPIMLTVNPETVDRYAESVRWLQDRGVRYLIGSLNYAGGWDDASLRRLKRQYLELEAWHFANYRAGRKFYFSPFDTRISARVQGRDSSCRLGVRQISVAPDGRLFPCVQFVGRDEYAIGTAQAGLDRARRDRLHDLNEAARPCCQGCDLDGRCHNKCGCLNIQTTGKLDELPPVLCEHERMIFPIADRLAGRLHAERNPLFLHRQYNPAFPLMSFLEDLQP